MRTGHRIGALGMLAALLLAGMVFAQPASILETTREVVLENGMKLLLVQRPGQPNIAAGWVAHVGSANEYPGITGMSHLFEHMMFKGSPRIGTRDAALDATLQGDLDALRAQMIELERARRDEVRQGRAQSINDPALQSSQMTDLKSEFDAAIERQRANMVKDEFDQIYTEAGATGLNAFTNQDMTVYFIRVPANKLQLWFWMESERLAQPVFREFYAERDVVFEERRLRTDSTPTGAQDEVFNSLVWRGHPYGWPVVGWPSDIAAITRDQATAYFDQYYSPANITLALVGDFDEAQALVWAERYFGRIAGSNRLPPDVITLATPQLGEITYRAEVEAPPSATVTWRSNAFMGDGDPELQILASVLSGKTGRLHKRLVLSDQIATSAGAGADSSKYGGTFSVVAQGKQDVSPQLLRTVLLEEVQKVIDEGITAYELEKVKNQLAADKYRRLEDPFFLLIQLLFYDGLRDWRTMETSYQAVEQVTADQVQAAAGRFLVTENRASKLYTRKPSGASEDPQLAQFDEPTRARIAQMLNQLATADAGQLNEALQGLQGMREQAPPAAQPALNYVIDWVEQRLEDDS